MIVFIPDLRGQQLIRFKTDTVGFLSSLASLSFFSLGGSSSFTDKHEKVCYARAVTFMTVVPWRMAN